jgi:hypothetical protein
MTPDQLRAIRQAAGRKGGLKGGLSRSPAKHRALARARAAKAAKQPAPTDHVAVLAVIEAQIARLQARADALRAILTRPAPRKVGDYFYARLETFLQQHGPASLATIRHAFAASMTCKPTPSRQAAVILSEFSRRPAVFAQTEDGLWYAQRRETPLTMDTEEAT